jgi:hypothetical protein
VAGVGGPERVKAPGADGRGGWATGENEMTGTASATNLDHRLDVLGWGVFFVMTGMLMLIPGLPEGTWLVGLGTLLLGLAGVRLALGLPFEWFGVILGACALLAGFGTVAGIDIPVFALFLVACGLALIAAVLSKARAER